jgi:branched-chain amino acid transport system permease protein
VTNYLLHVVILVGIYAILASSLDLLVGQTGLLSLSQAAFFGLGAYTTAILASRWGFSLFGSTAIGVGIAGVASLLVSLPSARLRDDYFALCTFGLQIVASSLFLNSVGVTGGALGLSGIPPLLETSSGREPRGREALLIAITCTLVVLLLERVSRSPFGRVLRSIREDEPFAQSLGKNTALSKMKVAMLSAALAALAGSLYARYATYIDPSLFAPSESIVILSMVVIGGLASTRGAFVGAAVVVGVPEVLRFVGLSGALAGNVRQILYGFLLIVTMFVRPSGLLGKYSLSRR